MKARNGVSAALSILVGFALAPVVAGAQVRETRPLTGFAAVEVSGGIDLFLRQGEQFVVEVASGDGNVADIVTEVRNETLEIRRKRSVGSFFNWNHHGSAYVTLPTLVSLTASGGSDVRAEGTFSSDELKLVASGGSDVTIDIAVNSLEAVASGGSDLNVSGSARSVRVQSSGGSDVNARGLVTDEAEVRSSGGSDLSIAVRERIVGSASGGSDVVYSGEPRTVDVDASGGSDVRRR